MERKLEAASHDARKLLLGEYHGILSTHSQDVPGYPFGSVMPYCLDADGQPIILISRIAQHTKNVEADPRVSLIISQSGVDDVHTGGRLTWLGDVEKLEADQDLQDRYYSFFPSSAIITRPTISIFTESTWFVPGSSVVLARSTGSAMTC